MTLKVTKDDIQILQLDCIDEMIQCSIDTETNNSICDEAYAIQALEKTVNLFSAISYSRIYDFISVKSSVDNWDLLNIHYITNMKRGPPRSELRRQ